MAPDGMPTLSRGNHSARSGQACVMEYVSVLAGETWSDSPRCTNPAVASVARGVNDNLSDAHRPLLVPLIGRLLEAHVPSRDKEQWLARELSGWQQTSGFYERYNAWVVFYGARQNPETGIALLTALLDKYDELVGRRRKSVEVPPAEFKAAAEVVAGDRDPKVEWVFPEVSGSAGIMFTQAELVMVPATVKVED